MKDKYSINNPETKDVNSSVENAKEPEVDVSTSATEEQTKPEKTFGVVINCARLRVRKQPSMNAIVAAEIEKGSEVVIDESKSTEDFYAIVTGSGLEGYCMKDYIQIKQ